MKFRIIKNENPLLRMAIFSYMIGVHFEAMNVLGSTQQILPEHFFSKGGLLGNHSGNTPAQAKDQYSDILEWFKRESEFQVAKAKSRMEMVVRIIETIGQFNAVLRQTEILTLNQSVFSDEWWIQFDYYSYQLTEDCV